MTNEEDTRDVARRFLMTTGAKALVLSDKGQDKGLILQGQDQEQEAKAEMLLEERTKAFKRAMHISPGVLVQKRGRNGKERSCFVKYEKLHKSGGSGGFGRMNAAFGITWRSQNFGLHKIFDVSALTHVPDPTNGGSNDGFVKLINDKRVLFLKFPPEVHPYFLHHLQSCPVETG